MLFTIKRLQLRLNPVACFIAAQLSIPTGMMVSAYARDMFNPEFLELGTPGKNEVDLSAFDDQGGQIPGTYRVDVFLNNEKMDTREVEFRMGKDASGNNKLLPCLPVDTLDGWGVITKEYPAVGAAGSACANIQAIPQASSDFQFNRQQLLLSFPQSAMNNSARGWVDPKSWDEGITALMLNYSASGSNNEAKNGTGNDSESQYINLRPGLNMGPWRLRNYTTWNRSRNGGPDGKTNSQWDTVYTYVQRDIIPLRAQLTMGDSSTPSDIYDSIPYRGAELASDDDMLPESLKGYAPAVRGIARTNAQVTVRQNGYIIYQTSVAPGAFEITDMYPTGSSGDLNVTIKESDGSEQQLVVPYASLPVLQREGRFKYSITSGVYRSYDSSVDSTPLTEATAIYGLPKGFTVYGGGQFASSYQSLALGAGKNMGNIGALSLDVTQAWSTMQDMAKESGQSWRVRYSKNFAETGTNFAIAGYRYATEGYWNMQEVLDSYHGSSSEPESERRRNRTELTMSQSLGEIGGSMTVSAIRENYYHSSQSLESYGLGYNNSWNSISYGLNYSYNRNTSNNGRSDKSYDEDQIFSANISIPFSVFGIKDSTTYVNYMLNTSKQGNTNNNVIIGGTALADNNLSWNMQEGYGSQGQGNSGGVNADWRATYGEASAGYSYDRNSKRLNYGIEGGILVHEHGITLGQTLGETTALLEAPDADNLLVQGQTGVKTDYRGYAIVPYVTAYKKNDLTLDTESFGDNTDVSITTQTVIPTRGAVVRARYKTSVGYRALMNLMREGNTQVPFGAMVTESGDKANDAFIVGDKGQVYITGLQQKGSLDVKWGNDAGEHCRVEYSLPAIPQSITNINALCR